MTQPDQLADEPFTGRRATRMSEFSTEFSAHLQRHIDLDQRMVPERIVAMLRASDELVQGFSVTQLEHGLQTATHAERAGMPVDVVVAALCHDMGKVISTPNHAAIAAEMIKLYVSDEAYFAVKVHQDFEGIHYLHKLGVDPMTRLQHADHPAYELAERFADEWDERAFDPDFATPPLEHFIPMIEEVFSRKPKLPDHWARGTFGKVENFEAAVAQGRR
jgi:predicted HD phosphohydrolase